MNDELQGRPLLNGTDRGVNGRFLPGCKPGPGNPFSAAANQLRAALCKSVTKADIRAIAKKLVELAKAGDIQAAKVVLDRAIGLPSQVDLVGRIEILEAALQGRKL